LVSFWESCFMPGLAWTTVSYLCFLCSWDARHVPLSPGVVEMESCELYSGCSWTTVLQISVPQVGRITDLSYGDWLSFLFWSLFYFLLLPQFGLTDVLASHAIFHKFIDSFSSEMLFSGFYARWPY
jgi:hypothetical protein